MAEIDTKKIVDKIKEIASPICESVGVDLYWVELAGSLKHPIVRIYIDAVDGIGIDDCVAVSQRLSPVLDVEDAIHGSYDLEVSSPGVNRILRDCKDFRVHKGEIAKVKMSEAQDGRRNFKGRIKSCDERVLSLEVDGRDVSLPLSEIDRANLEYEF